MSNYTFYSRAEYFEQLIVNITNAKKGDRIVVATMALESSEGHIKTVLDELCNAAKRGVRVRLMVDSIAFMITKGRIFGPLFYSKRLDAPALKRYSDKLVWLEKLAVNGVEYTITNRPKRRFSNPFAGRSHIKFAVINDAVYIGGCNLKEADRSDLMVHWNDGNIADWLFKFAENIHLKTRVVEVLNNTDVTMPVNKHSTLLVDAGVKNQSIIFENALRLIDEAEDFIVMSCQYFPNQATVQRLAKAVNRGVTVRLIYNHPSKHHFPLSLLHLAVRFFEKRRQPPVLFKYELSKNQDYIHAKLLATDKACLVGSHNYIQLGVRFGTAEIALLNTDPDFAKYAVKTVEEQL